MDRQARKLAITRNNNATEEGAGPSSDHGSEGGSNTDSDSDDKVSIFIIGIVNLSNFAYLFWTLFQKWIIHRGIRRESGSPPRPSFPSGENSKDVSTLYELPCSYVECNNGTSLFIRRIIRTVVKNKTILVLIAESCATKHTQLLKD